MKKKIVVLVEPSSLLDEPQHTCPKCRKSYRTPKPTTVSNKKSKYYGKKLCYGCAQSEN